MRRLGVAPKRDAVRTPELGAVALTALLLLAAGGRRAGRAASEHAIAEGRNHLRKANGLAGDDRCQAAIHEYTLAYKKLRRSGRPLQPGRVLPPHR